VKRKKPINKWPRAAILGAVGYLIAILLADPSLQTAWMALHISFGMAVLLAPAVGLARVASIDPDTFTIYGLIGLSNFLLYGFVGFQLSRRRESFPTYDDDLRS
jgi:hypothetical protein